MGRVGLRGVADGVSVLGVVPPDMFAFVGVVERADPPMGLKRNARLRGEADSTEVVVIRAPVGEIDLRCGGLPMVAVGTDSNPSAVLEPDYSGGTILGQRYADESLGLELLCIKPGAGSLSVGINLLQVKEAKPLPRSG